MLALRSSALLYHFSEFLTQKLGVLGSRFVWAPTQGCVLAVLCPRQRSSDYRCSHFAKAFKNVGCRVMEVSRGWSEIQSALA
jgi:hypothetical protein